MFGTVELSRDLKRAAPLRIEQRRKDRRRIEARKTKEIDRPIQRDERDGIQVADDGVILDRFEFVHRPALLFESKYPLTATLPGCSTPVPPLRACPQKKSKRPNRFRRLARISQ